MTINIGDAAIDRSNQWSLAEYTVVNKGGPADGNGIITEVKIHAETDHNLVDCIVGIFYTTNGNTLKCRSAVAIGAVEGGAIRTFPGLSLAVKTGDFIGFYYSAGWLSRDVGGFTAIGYIAGQYIDVDDEGEYTPAEDDAMSIHGTGEEVVPAGGGGGPGILVEVGVI